MTSGTDPFTPDAVEAIVRHMNADHAGDSLVICRRLGGVPEADEARLVGLGPDGLHLAATVGGAQEHTTVGWFDVPLDRQGIRHEIVRLFDAATAADSTP